MTTSFAPEHGTHGSNAARDGDPTLIMRAIRRPLSREHVRRPSRTAVRPGAAVDTILVDDQATTAPRGSTKMVDLASVRAVSIWDQAGTEPSRGGDPVDFLFDTTTIEAATQRRRAVARLAPPRHLAGDTIDTIFGGTDGTGA